MGGPGPNVSSVSAWSLRPPPARQHGPGQWPPLSSAWLFLLVLPSLSDEAQVQRGTQKPLTAEGAAEGERRDAQWAGFLPLDLLS